MMNEIKAGTQTVDSSSDTIELGIVQELGRYTQVIGTSVDELTSRLVDERIKQATGLILTPVEEV